MAKTSRTEIIAAARDVMRDKGYAGMSMQELANRVGLLKGSLYSHFSCKESLVPDVLALTQADMFENNELTGDWRNDYTKALESMVHMLATHHRCIGLHLAYGLDGTSPLLVQAVKDFFDNIQTHLNTLLQQGVEADLAAALAQESITAIEGATLWLVLEQNDAPLQLAKKRLLARAASLATAPPEDAVCQLLNQHLGDWRTANLAERSLAEQVIAAQSEADQLRAALEAASCG